MKKELWLEFGFIHRKQNNYHDMLWYNEGRWEELPYFLKALWKHRNRKDMYFFWRYGTQNHFIKS